MPDTEESLFSLELVVEKVYIPHVVCRFPAVAFRLLDFPTIVINHVEGDLGKAIRRQISFDPDYQLPEQFCEIKDKHGNFMIKKGKSCLFKMVAETLKNHLENTPLYVMVLDMFPETPKLVGNSTVPLNILINAICADLVRLGSTVPSVHGDKGLFKIYNLMGKEIGYFVLGFRLLCLGPSLIPHLPAAALVQRQSKKQQHQQQKQNKQLLEMVQLSQGEGEEGEEEEDQLIETRTWGSMTDPVKQDVMMQTVEMDHKGVHVDIQAPEAVMTSAAVQPTLQHHQEEPLLRQKPIQHSGTQTDKKGIKMAFNAKQKVFEDLAAMEDQEVDEVMIANIVCPPPLFFNSEAKPRVEVEDDDYSLDTDMSVSDDLTVDSLTDDEEDVKAKPFGRTKTVSKEPVFIDKGQIIAPPAPMSFQNVPMNVKLEHQPKQRSQWSAATQPSMLQNGGSAFPLLAALMNELLRIQDPGVLQGAPLQQLAAHIPQGQVKASDQKTSVAAGAASSKSDVSQAQRKMDEVNANVGSDKKELSEDKDIFAHGSSRKSHRKCAHPQAGVPRDKSWLRVIPEYQGPGQKKSKLMFGLTNTQRLRLQKTNPGWLRSMERAEAASKGGDKRAKLRKNDSGDELNMSNFSDTLTEVRRQAQRELEKTAANDSLASVSAASTQVSPVSPSRSPPHSPPKAKQKTKMSPKKSSGSPRAGRRAGVGTSPKFQTATARLCRPASVKGRRTSDTSEEPHSARPLSVDPSVKNIMSPDPGLVPPLATGDSEDIPMSARSVDQPSSARSRSIEVRMPSVQTSPDEGEGSEATITDTEDDEDDLPLPDESFSNTGSRNNRPISAHTKNMPLSSSHMRDNHRPQNFPSYLKRSDSLPESIDGRPNQSLNTSTAMDDDSPLESTRDYGSRHGVGQSSDFHHHPREGTGNSRNMQSTDDLDTRQTFHSTSEPELQGLVSDEEERKGPAMKFPVLNPVQSDNSPVPSTRRSMAKLDMSLSQQVVTPRGRDSSTPGSSRSASPKRPTPRPRRPLRDLRESVHTESVSSYMPSDPEALGSLSSGEGGYSEDFSRGSPDKPEKKVEKKTEKKTEKKSDRPRLIPSTKLGYTIY